MIPSEYAPILVKLLNRTQDGKVLWNQVSKDKFAVTFGSNSLTIAEYHGDEETNEPSSVDFRLLDSEGQTIDAFDVWDHEDDHRLAYSLYNAVRRRALKIDDALETLEGALDSGGVIGVSDKIPDDDDIPF